MHCGNAGPVDGPLPVIHAPPPLNPGTPEPASPELLRSSAVVGSMTLLSRVLGLVRDVAMASVVGASGNADAFFVAFKIPNFLRRLFAEGAFAQAFVPVLADYREDGSVVAVRALVDRVAGVLGGTLLVVTVLAILAAPLVAMLFAPGFVADPVKFELTAQMIRITFPYLLLISMTGFCGAILNSYGRFAVPALTPIFLNLSLIGAALVAAPQLEEPVFALAWGVALAGVVQLLFQLPFLYRLDLVPRPRWDTRHPGVRRILKLMVPALFGVSVSQINLLLDTVLASFLPTGSVSWLYYSDRLMELPLGVFGIAIATVILPSLSAHRAAARMRQFGLTLDWAVRSVLWVAVPAAVALAVLAQPILVTLFQYGEFKPRDVAMSALSLQAYSLGLAAFMLIKVLAPGYYARQDIATPVRFGIISMAANMVMNLLFVLPLLFWFGAGHVGLALATSAAAYLNAGLLLRGLLRDGVMQPQAGWVAYAVRLSLATASMVAVVLWLSPGVEIWLDWALPVRIGRLALVCALGGAVYLLVHAILGTRLQHVRTPPGGN